MVRKTLTALNLNDISLFDLQSILNRKIAEAQNKLPTLLARRNRIQEELTQIEAEIEALSGPEPSPAEPAKKRGQKPGRSKSKAGSKRTTRSGKMTLPLAIQTILEEAGKPLNLAEIREAILEKGLVKKPKKSFPAMVSMALSKGDQFKKVDRGVYTVKG